MKKIICFIVVMMMLSTQVLAATYYDVNVEGLTYSEKEDLLEWLEEQNMDYDVESYASSSSNTSSSSKKELVVEELSNSEKNTLVSWLENRDYDYITKTQNGYYYVTIGYTSTTKSTLINYLDNKGYEYDISSTKIKELVVEKLSSSQKSTLANWLNNQDYDYTTRTQNGYYYVTIEYTSGTKRDLINYLENKDYKYDTSNTSNTSNSSDRTGKAYLIANGILWYADGDDIEEVDDIYSPEYVLFTKDGGLAYIDDSKNGMYIEDMYEPTDCNQIVKSAKSISTNSNGYATGFKVSNKTTKIEADDDFNNEEMTVYVVKNNTLYSLSSKNKLSKLKSLKYVSTSSNYSKNYTNIGFSEWGDLVFIDSAGVCFFNEDIDETDGIQTLKDQNNHTVQAKHFTVSNGVINTVVLTNGYSVKLEDD